MTSKEDFYVKDGRIISDAGMEFKITDILRISVTDENGNEQVWYDKEKDGPYVPIKGLTNKEEE